MALKSRTQLKTTFAKGYKIKKADYDDIFDSFYSKMSDNVDYYKEHSLDPTTTGYGSPVFSYVASAEDDFVNNYLNQPASNFPSMYISGENNPNVDYHLFSDGFIWHHLPKARYGIAPYIAGTNSESRIITRIPNSYINTFEPCYIVFPQIQGMGGTYSIAGGFFSADKRMDIDTSYCRDVFIAVDNSCSVRGTSRSGGTCPIANSGSWYRFQEKRHITFECYPNDDTSYAWAMTSHDYINRTSTSFDGIAIQPGQNSNGALAHYTLDETTYNAVTQRTLSPTQFSAVTGYFGTPVDVTGIATVDSQLVKFALHIIQANANIILPDTPTDGDVYRFLQGYSSSGSNTLTSNTKEFKIGGAVYSSPVTGFAGHYSDYFEVQYSSFDGKWFVHSQNFLDFMSGLLPWSRVDKGSVATGTFTSQDGKTVTVTNGLITSIV